MRIGVQLTNVLTTTPDVYAVYDNFSLTMQHYCYTDYFTLTTAKQDFTHIIKAVDQGSNNYGTTNVPATVVS